MIKEINGVEVAGSITSKGKCPSCKRNLVSHNPGNEFYKSRGLAVLDNGEQATKCVSCGKFVMLPRKAA